MKYCLHFLLMGIFCHSALAQSFENNAESLNIFVGNWIINGSVTEQFSGSSGPVTGETTYYKDLGGSWLKFESELKIPGIGEYTVHGGVAFNSRSGKFDAYSINNIGFMIIYEGMWDQNRLIFTQTYPLPGGNSRLVYLFEDQSLTMISERKTDESEWIRYYESDLSKN